MMTVAVLGAGSVGSAVARLAKNAGFEVTMADCLPLEEVRERVAETVPGALVCEQSEVVKDAELVVLSVPLHSYKDVPQELLDDRVVVDLMNYWQGVDGGLVDVDAADGKSVSELVAAYFPTARWVKTLNHISRRHMEDDASAAGTVGRRALAVASDDEEAAQLVMGFLDRIGFDSVYSGSLATGEALEPGTDIFNGKFTKEELTQALQQTKA